MPYKELEVVYEGYSHEVPLRVPDLSTHGMFINTPRTFPEGAVLKLKFRLARTNFPIHARGEVRYCVPGVGIGIEFVEISEEAQEAIADELELGEAVEGRSR
jgi:hypothetical protein